MGSGKSKTESLKYLARKHLAKEFPDLGFWSGNLKCFIVARNNGNLEHIGPFSYISNTDSRKVEYKIKERNYREGDYHIVNSRDMIFYLDSQKLTHRKL